MDTPVPPHAADTPAAPTVPERPPQQQPQPPASGQRHALCHRDRHGRGMRGPLAPPQVPLSVSRSDAFDDLVRDAVDRLERRWPQLAEVEFAVQEVPGSEPDDAVDRIATAGDDIIPLGQLITAGTTGKGSPHRIVIYRRPVEIRVKNREERAQLVHEVVVEQVAELLGLSPENVDPRYGED